MTSYSCKLCNKDQVKLWRNSNGAKDLLCANCCENLQAQRQYVKGQWKMENGEFKRSAPFVLTPLPRWKIDKDGMIPYAADYAPNEVNEGTSLLPLLWGATFIPALPIDDTTSFYEYSSAPKEEIERWRKLPTTR